MNGDFLEHYFTNNDNLKSELKKLDYEINSSHFTFFSDNGVFSKDRIDFGSRALIENILEHENRVELKVLDVGCGYGLIGIVLARFLKADVTMSDINKRAMHLAERNMKENKVTCEIVESSTYQQIKKKYDLIVTNPPIRAGKDIVLDILENAQHYLNPGGTLWFVMKKDHGVKSILRELEPIYHLDILEKRKGFYIVRAQKD